MDVKINWKGKMAFEGASDSGFAQKMDSDLSAGGENSAIRPMELIAFGLAGCTGMDVILHPTKEKAACCGFSGNGAFGTG